MTPAEFAEVDRAVGDEVRRVVRKVGGHVSVDDLTQQAWEIALKAEACPSRDRSRSLQAYVRIALVRQLPRVVACEISAVTLHDEGKLHAADYAAADDVNVDEMSDEDAGDLVRLALIRAAVAEVLGDMDDSARAIARLIVDGSTPTEAAAELGIDVNTAYNAGRAFRRAASKHPVLRDLYGAPEERRRPALRIVRDEAPAPAPVADATPSQQQLTLFGLDPVQAMAVARAGSRCSARRPPAATSRRRTTRQPVNARQLVLCWSVSRPVQVAIRWGEPRRAAAVGAGREACAGGAVCYRAGP